MELKLRYVATVVITFDILILLTHTVLFSHKIKFLKHRLKQLQKSLN